MPAEWLIVRSTQRFTAVPDPERRFRVLNSPQLDHLIIAI